MTLFRSAMGMYSYVEEFLNLQEQIPTTVKPGIRNPANEEMKDNMETNKELFLRNLHINPMEKFMDKFLGSRKWKVK